MQRTFETGTSFRKIREFSNFSSKYHATKTPSDSGKQNLAEQNDRHYYNLLYAIQHYKYNASLEMYATRI